MSTTHTIGAFAVILDEAGKVLLSHRRDSDVWNLPGGKAEANEAPWAALMREVEEETGLQVRIERLLGVYAVASRSEVVMNFRCNVIGGALRASEEADRHAWFAFDAIPPNTRPRHVLRIADAFATATHVRMTEQE